ncbi:MAG: hypothetical protein Kow0032_12090 [Methyloligellaceae bacterium]
MTGAGDDQAYGGKEALKKDLFPAAGNDAAAAGAQDLPQGLGEGMAGDGIFRDDFLLAPGKGRNEHDRLARGFGLHKTIERGGAH